MNFVRKKSSKNSIKFMIKILLSCALGAALLMIVTPAPAQSQAMTPVIKPLLHPLFSENAVLQRDCPLNIWGWAQPDADVTVKFGGGERVLRSDKDGYWSVPIRPRGAGGPYSLEVSSGNETQTRGNLMFGDVWLCSGQSNMEWPLNNANNAAAEKAAANYPNIRLLTVPKAIRSAPIDTFEADWKVCDPQTAGDFSAVGYFFGRKLNQDLKVPIGLIDSSWGGTVAEAWVSAPALKPMGDFNGTIDAMEANRLNPSSLEMRRAAWWQNDAGTKAGWQNANYDDAAWKTIEVPGAWESKGYADFDGVMWLRCELNVPAAWAGRDVRLKLGAIDDSDTTYWNGTVVGATDGYNKARDYLVPGAQVKAGRTVIAIRVLDTGGGGGLTGPELSMVLADTNENIFLDGTWKINPGATLKELPAFPTDFNQNSATALYNGMISPLLPGQIKGAIWYQGESNAGRAKQYQTLLPTLINDWRARFGAATGAPMPFYIVQLANYQAPTDNPNDGGWAELREAQSMTAKNVADVGLAVISDIGEEKDIHPRNKQDVGLRLALQALKNTYGQNVQAAGPTLRAATPDASKMVLTFDNADGLMLKGDANHVFAVAGADKKFSWATPTINGNAITLNSADVAAPLYARFGFSDNPRANLYNSAGLPASPFRTDSD